VKALILAAGYATRLRPLTESIPKQLLPIGGRPMVDWIVDKIRETDVDDIHLVTNHRFAADFARWAPADVTVHDDGTTSNEDRLGAIGDIQFVGIDDDLLAIAGDNLFDYSVLDYVEFWRTKPGASCVAVHDVGDPELAKQYGIVELEGDDRITAFVDKAENPPWTLCASAT
jgi:glucose-1-phosphate thymidylyltransferase